MIGFSDGWLVKRRFPVDMAGFAVGLGMIRRAVAAIDESDSEVTNDLMPYKAGHEEDLFLRRIGAKMEEMEALAQGCKQVLVWHTQVS